MSSLFPATSSEDLTRPGQAWRAERAIWRSLARIALFELHLRVTGEAELAELPWLIRPGRLAVDVGAHAGLYTWAMARLGAQVIAFEPNPALASKVNELGLAGVEVRCAALSDRPGIATLTLPGNKSGLATLQPTAVLGPRLRVQTATLDSQRLGAVGFMKIDVEGHEEAVLKGARGIIEKDSPALLVEIEERHNPGGLQRITAALAGYRGWFLYDSRWWPLSSFDAARHQDERLILRTPFPTPRRVCRYVNNFLFLPEGRTPRTMNA